MELLYWVKKVIPKGLMKKRKFWRGGGLTSLEFWGHGGVMHFGISEGTGGSKYGSHLWLGMDIFWNCPMHTDSKKQPFLIPSFPPLAWVENLEITQSARSLSVSSKSRFLALSCQKLMQRCAYSLLALASTQNPQDYDLNYYFLIMT